MPFFQRDDAQIYYEEHGKGFPVLLVAAGGMRSSLDYWGSQRAAWNAVTQLSPRYRVIAMDQRNAGRSRASIRETDGWQTYADDQLALLDHLGVTRFHTLGACIGGSFVMGLIRSAPGRVASAVIMQTIGMRSDEGNRATFNELFDGWKRELQPARPEVSDAAWRAFAHSMFGGDFLFNVSREFVAACRTPLLVLMGNDEYHPSETSREIASLAANARLIERWREPDLIETTKGEVERFLAAHTPKG